MRNRPLGQRFTHLPGFPVPAALLRVLAFFVIVLTAAVGTAYPGDRATTAASCHRLVVLGDPHLPGRDIDRKRDVLKTINSWNDVETVVAVGDICAEFGTAAEYRAAQTFFSKLLPPLLPIAGNHDYIYADPSGSEKRLTIGTPSLQKNKLRMFRQTFGLPQISYTRHVGRYFLVFLSTDNPAFLAGISDAQLKWLRDELAHHAKEPTIVFFHGPLRGTLRNYRHWINTPDFIAQPEAALHQILQRNRQVFLWVSGHTHTPPLEESYASAINLYEGRITDIHNTDMNHGAIWTNSLYLYPDKVVVRTYDHARDRWLTQFDRTIAVPKLWNGNKR